MKHASFFSGVGGLDLGFERAGIHTVSVSEIDPYASSVLAERFPDAQNLGDIVKLAEQELGDGNESEGIRTSKFNGRELDGKNEQANQQSPSERQQKFSGDGGWRTADIWSGGFPCQDLSVAGKRAGFAGKRSSLAFTFLNLVERHRPRWLVLENVPGLFSSNKGADFGRLLYEMEQLRYGVSWRTLDARYFGVAQRRRRVFIVASLESDRAGEVLFECEGCERHRAPRKSSWQGVASGTSDGSGGNHHGAVANQSGASPNSDGVRATDGLARRLDNQQGVARKASFGHYEMTEQAGTLKSSGGDIGGGSENLAMVGYQTRVDEKHGNFSLNEAEVANSLSALWPSDTSHRSMPLVQAVATESILSFPSRFGSNANVTEDQAQSMAHSAGAPAVFRKSARAQTDQDFQTWVEGDVANTLNSFDVGDVRTTHAIVSPTLTASNDPSRSPQSSEITAQYAAVFEASQGMEFGVEDDPLLPLGLDSHRYRCCGNGVVAPVAEWIGRRIVEVDRRWREEDK